jgi:hypothetical protein
MLPASAAEYSLRLLHVRELGSLIYTTEEVKVWKIEKLGILSWRVLWEGSQARVRLMKVNNLMVRTL